MKNIFGVIALIAILWSCENDESEALDIRAQMEVLEKEIKSIVKTECSSVNCDEVTSCGCSTMGYGKKPCGGPWQYVVYSSSSTNDALLQSKIEEYNELNQLLNEKEGLVSDCALEHRPLVECFEGHCQGTSK